MHENPNKWRIKNVKIVVDTNIIEGSLLVDNGIISAIIAGNTDDASLENAIPTIDGAGGWLLPGFIDIHVHGGYGADFMEATEEAYHTITKFHASNGTTRMLATTVTASPEDIDSVLHAASAYMNASMPYAALEGVHLEGPFISELWPGAQNPNYISPPRLDWVQEWNKQYPGKIKQLTLAPEKEGSLALIQWLAEQGIVAACGHTDAKYADILAAADAGLTQAVHTYNAMRGLHHREPGTLGAVLTDERIYAELIADGHHVHPAAIRLLLSAKPSDKVILITDAMAAAGLGDGEYELGGLVVDVVAGVAALREGGNLAGSTLTMIDAFRYILTNTSLSVPEISVLASANPAQQLGLKERTGTIAAGKLADLVWTDSKFETVLSTWVQGRQVFAAEQ
ncbi:N-acetylglucosamine-6-phosphate deacetylase [Paenibacillus baekrokdamisoli]|uniref:N-acetylglucosamine-6-phosphate deacetylase n=1 Tax=Paenibacillus baekrokdamisoli TaxID=1712516 RepID=A0A3G9JC35_9BACL|nr:N-acetylglucosamine-6-phosphate deacetylase [Paenibacillus baekrokdamisoli]MBB3071051.1 N-acetylglucosamine-6-phosphate deacetylase [Paenibacillus baekrokdamisoli]BBH21468.1 N-acetylglucosamine-6-phosphate deacetylase [Paenibacillus baekrokdamisoli]